MPKVGVWWLIQSRRTPSEGTGSSNTSLL